MSRAIIKIPSLKDDESGYKSLFKIADEIISNPMRHFDFNFHTCAILDQNAVAMLGGLARYVDTYNSANSKGLAGMLKMYGGVMFMVDSMSPLIRNKLITNNFLSHFTKESFEGYPKGDYVGYREHTQYLDSNEIALHLKNEWLSSDRLSISEDLKSTVISRIFEIFMNAYGHGVEKIEIKGLGVISCSAYDTKQQKLKLSVLDFGVGIIENVKEHLDSGLEDIEAMTWALELGNTTQTDSVDKDMPRGVGFGLLNEFVSLNKGSLSIFSNSCCAHINKSGEYIVSSMKIPFKGTLVNVSINCDDRHYKFIEEDSKAEQYY